MLLLSESSLAQVEADSTSCHGRVRRFHRGYGVSRLLRCRGGSWQPLGLIPALLRRANVAGHRVREIIRSRSEPIAGRLLDPGFW